MHKMCKKEEEGGSLIFSNSSAAPVTTTACMNEIHILKVKKKLNYENI